MPPDLPRRDRRNTDSPVGDAMVWSARIMAIGLSMFVPGVIGGWLDARSGLQLLGPIGFLLGFGTALFWLTRIAAKPKE